MSSWDFLRQPDSIDSSDSEDENGQIKDPPRSYPHMKLFSEEKRKRMEEERALLWEARRAGIDENDYASCKTWRMWAHKRFFNTIIGFHLGSLDLTGRHKERYEKLRARLNRLILEFQTGMQLFESLNPSVAEGHNRIWDLFKDDLMWSVFTERWKLHEEIDPKEFVLEFTQGLKGRAARKDYLQNLASSSRARYTYNASRIISQPQMATSIRSLILLNLWGFDNRSQGPKFDQFDPAIHEPSFYNIIYEITHSAVAKCQSLTTLELRGFQVAKQFIETIQILDCLHTLKCHSCWVDEEIMELVGDIEEGLVIGLEAQHIHVLKLYLRDNLPYDGHEPWYLIAFFTNLRDLVMEPDPDAFCGLPDRFFTSTFPVFSTLERFSAMEGEITPLITWILDPSSATDLGSRTTISTTVSNLTHFRFHTLDPMRRDTIQIIVSALHHAPNLRLLALEMIYLCDATPDLVQVISSALPRITGLTLKTSARKCPRWICPIWEYGKPFASFKNLEYFGWDYRCEVTYTPIDFSFVENGYPD
ncbi:hypothetical protein FRB91_005850, partial [Serendipita sp. 411]